MGGWPLLSDPYYGYFYPLNFVFYLGTRRGEPPSGVAGGVAAGLGLSAALHAFLAGVGMFVYLRGRRRRRLSFGAALFGGISFALSSFLVVRIRHIIYVQMMAWVPFLLAAIDANLSPGGSFGVLLPYHRTAWFEELARTTYGFTLKEQLLVRQSPRHEFFRSILYFSRHKDNFTPTSELTIQGNDGAYTEDFAELMKDYYLYL